MEENSHFDSFELQITKSSQDFLRTASGWAMFLSIVGFIGCGLGLMGSLSVMALGNMGGTGGVNPMAAVGGMSMGVMLLVFTVVMFFPVLYLFKFASKTKDALNSTSTELITQAFSSLKSYFVWAGILTIVYIVGYTIFIVIVGVAAAGAAGAM